MAVTNADGWFIDEYDIDDTEVSNSGIEFKVTFFASGEQHEDKCNWRREQKERIATSRSKSLAGRLFKLITKNEGDNERQRRNR